MNIVEIDNFTNIDFIVNMSDVKGRLIVCCRSSNIFDNMLAIMEKYANTLESLVDERTILLAQEKKTTEMLLLRMLPK